MNAALPQPSAAAPRRDGHEAWLDALAEAPWATDFYQALRRIAAAHPELPPLGKALRPRDEPLRVGQPPELGFAPASLHAFERGNGGPHRIAQRVFGLLGSNGALPLHLTEYARERATHHGDLTLMRFLDMLTHRFALLFYRAWSDAQPTVALDRAGDRSMVERLGAIVGIGLETLQGRDALPDASRLHFIGRLGRQTRDADGLLAFCRTEFDVPVAIEQWRGHWMPLEPSERSRLGRGAGARLGRGAVLGSSVWDVQHRFRVVIGPLSLQRYRRFLPGGPDLARLRSLVRTWVGLEFEWDVQLVLRHDEVPACHLGETGPDLGRVTWLGRRRRVVDAADLCIPGDAEGRPAVPLPMAA